MKVSKAHTPGATAVKLPRIGSASGMGGRASARGFPARMLIYLIERFSLLTVAAASCDSLGWAGPKGACLPLVHICTT